MLVLGIETSCDETGLALYDSEEGLLADELYSQIDIHQDYGGVSIKDGIKIAEEHLNSKYKIGFEGYCNFMK